VYSSSAAAELVVDRDTEVWAGDLARFLMPYWSMCRLRDDDLLGGGVAVMSNRVGIVATGLSLRGQVVKTNLVCQKRSGAQRLVGVAEMLE
jgi:hypothetical protein